MNNGVKELRKKKKKKREKGWVGRQLPREVDCSNIGPRLDSIVVSEK